MTSWFSWNFVYLFCSMMFYSRVTIIFYIYSNRIVSIKQRSSNEQKTATTIACKWIRKNKLKRNVYSNNKRHYVSIEWIQQIYQLEQWTVVYVCVFIFYFCYFFLTSVWIVYDNINNSDEEFWRKKWT